MIALVVLAFLSMTQAAAPAAGLAPQPTLQRIAALLESQNIESAAHESSAALREYPNDPVLHNLAGVIDAERNDMSAAEAHFEQAIHLSPGLVSAYENLGRLYQEHSASDASNRRRALDVYSRLLIVDPSNAEGLYQSAFLLALDGRFTESAALIARMPDDLRGRPQVVALSALNLSAAGDAGSAAAAVKTLAVHPDLTAPDVLGLVPAFDHLTDFTTAQALLETLDARQLADAGALERLGELYMRSARYSDARATLERVSAAGPPSVPVLMNLARAADKLGDHTGALGYLAHARSVEPKNANVHFMFGMICVEQNLVREAYESLKQAVTLAPENPLINYAMGSVSIHRHEPAEALPYFEKYVQLVPADPRGRFALGVARFTAGQLDEAAKDLHEAATHDETAGGAHYFLARIARQANDLETAEREVREAIARVPDYADAWAEAGLIETRAGRYDDAATSLGRALQLDPENYQATVNLTALYTRTKDPRREEQAARLAALQQKREERAQDFLRIIQVVP